LSGFIGRKTLVGGYVKSDVKSPGLTGRGRSILASSRQVGGSGIPGVVVECVDIGRNTSGEGGFLDLI
jgi:hypothetical protein